MVARRRKEDLLENGGKVNIAEKHMWEKGKERNSWKKKKKNERKMKRWNKMKWRSEDIAMFESIEHLSEVTHSSCVILGSLFNVCFYVFGSRHVQKKQLLFISKVSNILSKLTHLKLFV